MSSLPPRHNLTIISQVDILEVLHVAPHGNLAPECLQRYHLLSIIIESDEYGHCSLGCIQNELTVRSNVYLRDSSVDDIADCLDYIKTRLTPYPFEVAQVPTGRVRPPAERIRPDVAFIRTEDGYRVQLIERGRYRLGLNPHYVEESNAASLSPSDRQFMRRCLVDAKIFVRAIEQRWTTLQAISECIGEFQREFLDEGLRVTRENPQAKAQAPCTE